MDIANDILQGSDGDLYTVGYSYSDDGNFDTNNGWEDAKIIKTHLNGVIEWETSFGGSDADVFTSITNSGDAVIAAGWSASDDIPGISNLGSEDGIVVKFNQNGEIVWCKNFGGNSSDRINKIITLQNGSYIVAGYTYSSNLLNNTHLGSSDYWLINISQQGELLWQKNYGGSDDDFAVDLIEAQNGDLIIAGNSNSIDFDVNGNYGEWDAWIVRTNASGEILWEQNYGNISNDEVAAIVELPNTDIMLVGNSFSMDDNTIGKSDGWVIKTSENGAIQQEQKFGGKENDILYSVAIDDDSQLLMSGITYSEDGQIDNNEGNGDGWLLKLDENADFLWSDTFGGAELDDIQNAIYTNSGSIAIAGNSKSHGADVAFNNGDWDIWTLELNGEPLNIDEDDILLYPNPTSDFIHVISDKIENAQISIIAISGAIIYSETLTSMEKLRVDISNYPSGSYIVSVVTSENKINKPFIKL